MACTIDGIYHPRNEMVHSGSRQPSLPTLELTGPTMSKSGALVRQISRKLVHHAVHEDRRRPEEIQAMSRIVCTAAVAADVRINALRAGLGLAVLTSLLAFAVRAGSQAFGF
jgi:hypothetical protein